jgi:hypothetical protein
MNPQQEKIEQLTKMAERLMQALETDIAALEAGRPKHMRMIEPEIQRLSILYSREVKTLDPAGAKTTPPEVRKRFFTTTNRFRDLLNTHMRLVKRVRSASEGIIKAVADDAERRRNAMRPYVSPKTVYRSRPGALVYNNVV